ncbi:MAG: hydrogenase maturation protease [Polyangiaceae bacterium]
MSASRVLVAGVGNVLLRDDGFGVEVARRLLERRCPEGVIVRDFGIRGIDFAFALVDGYDAVILVDALRRGRDPGTLYVLEPDVDLDLVSGAPATFETHAMDPARVLRYARSLGDTPACMRIVGCEPAELGDEDEPAMGLSPVVEAAVDPAVALVEDLLRRLASGEPLGGADA